MEDIRSIYYFLRQENVKSVEERDEDLIKLLDADLSYKLRGSINKNNTERMMNTEIKIFIASQSILASERDYVENLIRVKNDEFIAKGIYLKPIRWEASDKGNSAERKQDEFNRLLLDSEYVIYLTWDSIGTYTKEEFELGYNNMKNGGKPFRVYILNKATPRRMKDKAELQSASDYMELKEQVWKDGKFIIDYVETSTLKDEIELFFKYIIDNH